MSDIHIDDFYRDTARILVALYNQFPRKTTLYVEDIAGPDKPDEFGLHSPRHLACLHTLLWLAHTDYLHYESLIREEAVDQIVLSHRAFLLLNSVRAEVHKHPTPESKDTTPTAIPVAIPLSIAAQENLIINRIRRELKDGTSFTLATLMREIMVQSRELN